MTKAQKENQARFKAVQAEAKKLKAKNPKLAHTDAVKKAWAIILGKAPAKKIGAVKKVAVKKSSAKNPAVKKPAVKKAVAKKTPVKSYHKDAKSHNVNIRVMSGTKKTYIVDKFFALQQYKDSINNIERFEKVILYFKNELPKLDKINKAALKKEIIYSKKVLAECKAHAKELKKLI